MPFQNFGHSMGVYPCSNKRTFSLALDNEAGWGVYLIGNLYPAGYPYPQRSVCATKLIARRMPPHSIKYFSVSTIFSTPHAVSTLLPREWVVGSGVYNTSVASSTY